MEAPKESIIEHYSKRELITHLSFSRLKELSHSPLALKRYIDQKKEPTAAMNAGSLLDCLLFTPDEFDKTFFLIPKFDKRTKEGKAGYEMAIEAANGRITIDQEQYDEAIFLNECIRNNSTVAFHGLLNPDFFKFQVGVKFFYNGFLHRGIKDADGNLRDGRRCVWDLKRMGSRSGEQLVRSQIRNMKYVLQGAIYCHEFDIKNEDIMYLVIAVDNEGYVTPFEITRDARFQARMEWNMLIKAAHRCNFENLDAGTEFWAGGDGFFVY